ncbi:MAG: Ig-like domain-containing protein, partial [Patescibacteria group bacterium]
MPKPEKKTVNTKKTLIPFFILTVALLGFMGYAATYAAFQEPTGLPPEGQPVGQTGSTGDLSQVLTEGSDASDITKDTRVGGRFIVPQICIGLVNPDCKTSWAAITGGVTKQYVDDAINNLKLYIDQKITDINTEITNIKNQLASLTQDITDIDARVTNIENNQGGGGGISTGAGSADRPLAFTSGYYPGTGVGGIDTACKTEFGSLWRLAAPEEVLLYVDGDAGGISFWTRQDTAHTAIPMKLRMNTSNKPVADFSNYIAPTATQKMVCIRQDAPLLYTTGYYPGMMVLPIDRSCNTEYGSAYKVATNEDILLYSHSGEDAVINSSTNLVYGHGEFWSRNHINNPGFGAVDSRYLNGEQVRDLLVVSNKPYIAPTRGGGNISYSSLGTSTTTCDAGESGVCETTFTGVTDTLNSTWETINTTNKLVCVKKGGPEGTASPLAVVPPISSPDLVNGSDSGYRNDDNITSDSTPEFSGSCYQDGSTVTIKEGNTTIGTGACANNTYKTPVSTLTDGTHSIVVTFSDSSGTNESTPSPALSVLIDTIAPTVPGLPLTASPAPNTTQSVWTWTASTDAVSGLHPGDNGSQGYSGPYVVQWAFNASFTNPNNENWGTTTYNKTPATAGTWYLRVRAIDKAGNQSGFSPAGSVFVFVPPTTSAGFAGTMVPYATALSNGRPIMAYVNTNWNSLEYVYCSDAACTSKSNPIPIDSGLSPDPRYRNIAMTVRANGSPVVVYIKNNWIYTVVCADITCGTLSVYRDNSLLTITAATNEYPKIAVTVGANNLPRVAVANDHNLWTGFCVEQLCSYISWTRLTPLSGTTSPITLAQNGIGIQPQFGSTPWIAWREDSNIKVLHCTNDYCTTAIDLATISDPDIETLTVNRPSMVLGSDGFPMIAYHAYVQSSTPRTSLIRYFHCAGAVCTVPGAKTIDTEA